MMHSSSQRVYSRFIPREELGDVVQWKFGSVDGSEPEPVQAEPEPVAEIPHVVDEGALQAQQDLLDQTREQGRLEGVMQGQAETALEWQRRMDDYIAGEGQRATQQLQAVLHALETSLHGVQQAIAQQVLLLACDIAKQVVRKELSVQPDSLLPAVKEAVQLLVAEGKPATVKLHPDDLERFASTLAGAVDAPGVQWVGDAAVSPGGCVVESAGTLVDASVATRWQRAIAALGLSAPWQEEAGHER